MTHTAGFADRFHGVYEPHDPAKSLGDVLRNNVPERVRAPGSVIAYSNYGAALAAYIVERVRGRPYEQVIQDRIFRPAGMMHSSLAQPVPQPLRRLLASNYGSGSRTPNSFQTLAAAPAGSGTASPLDMGRLLTMLMRGGQGQNGRVLQPATVEQMMMPHQRLVPGTDSGFGLGFMLGEHRGVRFAGHGGNMRGVATYLHLLPDHGLGWYFVFNGQAEDGATSAVGQSLAKAIIDAFVAPGSPAIQSRGPSSATDAAGIYVSTRRPASGFLRISDPMKAIEVFAEPDGSIVISNNGRYDQWLPAGRDRFIDRRTGAMLAAFRGADGRVARLASPELNAVAEFERASTFIARVDDLARFSIPILIFGALAGPLAWLVRRFRRRPRPQPSASGRRTRPLARLSLWLILATMLAWFATVLMVVTNVKLLFAGWHVIPAVLALASVVFVLLIAVDAAVAWRDPARGLPARIGGVVLVPAAAAMSYLFYGLGLMNLSSNW